MSWTVILFQLKTPPLPVRDLPDNWRAPSFDTARAKGILSDTWRNLAWDTAGWGTVSGPDWSIDVALGADPRANLITLHVLGGDAAMPAIETLLKATGWYAMDTASGTWIDPPVKQDVGFAQFRAYCDQVMTQPPPRRGVFNRLMSSLGL